MSFDKLTHSNIRVNKKTMSNLRQTTPQATLDGYMGETQQLEIVKALIKDESMMAYLTMTDQNIFSNPLIKVMIGRCKEYVNQYKHLPSKEELKDLCRTSNEIDNQLTEAQIEDIEVTEITPYIKDKYSKFVTQQHIVKLANTLLKNASNGNLDLQPIERFKEELSTIQPKENEHKPITLFEDLEEYITYKREVIPTYHKALDEHLNGGLERGAITLLLAGTGIGKTTITTHLCNKMALQGYNVLQIVFEDNIQTIRNKHFAKLVNKNIKWVDENKKEVIAFLQQKYPNECKQLTEHLRIVRLPNNQMTITEIENYIKKVNEDFKIDVISLDYLSCLKHINTFQPPHVEEGEMVRDLERIANEMNIVLMLAEQLNRSGNGSDASMMNVQGSISKAQDANTIILLSRTQDQQKESKADLSIEKCRNGFGFKKWENITFDNGTLQLDFSTANNNDVAFK